MGNPDPQYMESDLPPGMTLAAYRHQLAGDSTKAAHRRRLRRVARRLAETHRKP